MFQSLKLGRLSGIDVFVHPTFWLLPLFVLLGGYGSASPGGIALDLAVLFGVFGCVVLHELGHALAARGYGIGTHDITLYPIGGVARLENMPEKPGQEIAVALAGPAVNVVIAFGIAFLLLFSGVSPVHAVTAFPGMEAFWGRLLLANVCLVGFNLIPAFPMDGGRLLRAALSWFTDRVSATEAASAVGAVFAVLFAAYGLYEHSIMPAVLAFAVFTMGRNEVAQVRALDEERQWRRGRSPLFRAEAVAHTSGWEFDPATRVWTEWHGGRPVRRMWEA